MARASFRREDADVRCRSLIDATAKCLAWHGAGGVSVRMICREAGVSPGLLTHYFDGVDALIVATYRAVGDTVADTLRQAVADAGDDPRARLDAYVVTGFLPPLLDPELLATWLAFWSLVKSDGAVRAVHSEIYGGYRAAMGDLVKDCLGRQAAQADIRLVVVGITALVDGLWLELCLDERTFTPEEARLMAIRWVDSLLAAPPGSAPQQASQA